MTHRISRLLAGFLVFSFLLIQPAYALPTTVPLTVIDPTKRLFTYDANGNLTEELAVGTGVKAWWMSSMEQYSPLLKEEWSTVSPGSW